MNHPDELNDAEIGVESASDPTEVSGREASETPSGSVPDDRGTSSDGKGEVKPYSVSKMDIKNADSRELFADDGGLQLGQDTTVDGDKVVAAPLSDDSQSLRDHLTSAFNLPPTRYEFEPANENRFTIVEVARTHSLALVRSGELEAGTRRFEKATGTAVSHFTGGPPALNGFSQQSHPMNSSTPPPSLENPRPPTREEIRVMLVKREVRIELFRRQVLKNAAAANIGQARQQAGPEASSLTAGRS